MTSAIPTTSAAAKTADKSDPAFLPLFRKVLLRNDLQTFGEEEFAGQFERFTKLYRTENAVTNLSAIRDVPEIIAKHFADCLFAAGLIPEGASVLDVGCGGGFPCVPLAIVRPDLRITAIDSTAKKVRFVAYAARSLRLSNLKVLNSRAEDAGFVGHSRESFDVVISRAVANLRMLAELPLPFVTIGGLLIAMKGAQAGEELAEAGTAIRTLGGTFEQDVARTLWGPSGGSEGGFASEERHLLLIRKKSHTQDKYPRSFAAIRKNPL